MKKILTLLLLCLPMAVCLAQSEKRNSVGVSFITLPFSSKYIFGEYEFFLSDHAALAARVGYFEYIDDSEDYEETGSGLGWGATFRWYFGNKPMQGFLVGAGFEFFKYEWESDDGGYGSAFEVAPHGQVGYRFNFGNVVYLTPSVVVGPTISIATDLDSDASLFAMPVLVIGVRF